MLDQLEERYDAKPEEALVDSGFAWLKAIDKAADRECDVYAPLKDAAKQQAAGKDPYAAEAGGQRGGGGLAGAAWARLWGKAIYKLRCQTAEWVNAICRNRGLWQMPVSWPSEMSHGGGAVRHRPQHDSRNETARGGGCGRWLRRNLRE